MARRRRVRRVAMPKIRPTTIKKPKLAVVRLFGRPTKPGSRLPGKLPSHRRRAGAELGEIVHTRAEVEAATAEARKSHERLREAIDILPQGIVFLDADG